MTNNHRSMFETRLLIILEEIERQGGVGAHYLPTELSFLEQMAQIREYIVLAGEYGLAYECLVATVEKHPFVLTGAAAIALLELGLLFGFKTTRDCDTQFNRP